MEHSIIIKRTNPNEKNVELIIEELSNNLFERFGSDGKNSFLDWEYNNPYFTFVIALIDSEIVGCGAIRPINKEVGEVKRMFSKYSRKKIGQIVLSYLEKQAKEIGYKKLILETRVKNTEACSFYQKMGYIKIPNYGKYENNPEAICFEKLLTPNKNVHSGTI